jgi:hypothetical protein
VQEQVISPPGMIYRLFYLFDFFLKEKFTGGLTKFSKVFLNSLEQKFFNFTHMTIGLEGSHAVFFRVLPSKILFFSFFGILQ